LTAAGPSLGTSIRRRQNESQKVDEEASLSLDEDQEMVGRIKSDLLSESDKWAFQSLRLAYVVEQVNDSKSFSSTTRSTK
jgi:hypothetical protein